jgi:Uma2 family endonuclease
MASLPHYTVTPEEYLARERAAETKSEYFAGEIFAMSGATREHNLITGNVHAELRHQLRQRDCEAYANDMRVRVRPTGLYTYPDVVVVCGGPEFEDADVDTLLNPTVIVEVLSTSTEAYDRGTKFTHYRTIEALREYVVVSQQQYLAECFTRQPDGRWLLLDAAGLDASLDLGSIDCRLELREVYARVQIPEPAATGRHPGAPGEPNMPHGVG